MDAAATGALSSAFSESNTRRFALAGAIERTQTPFPAGNRPVAPAERASAPGYSPQGLASG
jgi:hypothetical protein